MTRDEREPQNYLGKEFGLEQIGTHDHLRRLLRRLDRALALPHAVEQGGQDGIGQQGDAQLAEGEKPPHGLGLGGDGSRGWCQVAEQRHAPIEQAHRHAACDGQHGVIQGGGEAVAADAAFGVDIVQGLAEKDTGQVRGGDSPKGLDKLACQNRRQ